METTPIGFIGTLNHGYNVDMEVLQEQLRNSLENPVFRYLFRNEKGKNKMIAQGVISAKKDFCKLKQHLISIDYSMTSNKDPEGNYKKILIAIPYDYQFDYALNGGEHLVSHIGDFTNVIASSPFTANIFRDICKEKKVSLLEGQNSPFAWMINQQFYQNEVQSIYERYFPAMKGKKILGILTDSKIARDYMSEMEDFPLKSLLDQLDEEWFVITNNWFLREAASKLPAKYCRKFAYIDKLLAFNTLLAIADVLVTNNNLYVGYFASRRKPVFIMKYSKKHFEKYMTDNYPQLVLHSLSQLPEYIGRMPALSEKMTQLQENFSYENGDTVNPCIKIEEILYSKG